MAVKKGNMISHIDCEWISKRAKGHGVIYSYSSPDGLATIAWVGGIGRVKILWYNVQLFLRFVKRRLR